MKVYYGTTKMSVVSGDGALACSVFIHENKVNLTGSACVCNVRWPCFLTDFFFSNLVGLCINVS